MSDFLDNIPCVMVCRQSPLRAVSYADSAGEKLADSVTGVTLTVGDLMPSRDKTIGLSPVNFQNNKTLLLPHTYHQ